MSHGTDPIEFSTLTAEVLRVPILADDDPGGGTVEFAWLAFGTDPESGAWEDGAWVDDGSGGTLKGPGREGDFGWLADTPVIGPLNAGLYGLWIRVTDGAEILVERVDLIEVSGSSTSGSESSGSGYAKGDLRVYDGSSWVVLSVGADGEIIFADSGEDVGLAYGPAPGGSGSTDLTVGSVTSTTLDIESSSGTNATVPAATTDDAGLMTAAQFDELATLVGHDHDADYDVLGAAAAAQAAAEATAAAALSAHEADSTSVHGIADTSALLDGTHTADGDAHHAEAHTVASHSDTTATGAQLDELTDGSETTLHSHASSGGDVVGPASAVDDRIVTFDGTTGKLIQDSGVTTAEFSALVSANAAAIAAVGAPLDLTVTRSGLAVIDRTATPPGGPSTGDAYLVIATASGDWAGQEDDIAWWTGTVWSFISPESGRRVYPGDEAGGYYYWNGSAWVAEAGGGDLLAANNLSDVDTPSTARTNLGLAIGSDVQAWDADLDAVSGTNTGDEDAASILAILAANTANVDLNDVALLQVGPIEERVNTVAATGATETLDIAEYGVHDVTMDEDCTFTFSNPAASGEASSFTLILRGAFTPTLPASVDWAGGSAPTYATPSVFEFTTVDGGTVWIGFLAGSAIA